jgi:hypothetical protein
MARGWESKSVEDQIAARESAERDRQTPVVDAGKEARRRSLELARARAQQDLQLACDRRHRAMLEQTIAHLDKELSEQK